MVYPQLMGNLLNMRRCWHQVINMYLRFLDGKNYFFDPGESKEARYYRAVAQIRQQEMSSMEAHINPVDIIDEDIQKQKDLLQKSDNAQSQIVIKKINELLDVRREFEEQELVYVYERDALLH